MLNLKSKLLATAAALFAASVALAQDSGPLIDLLVKKGLIQDQEAEELRAELARDASAGILSTISGGKSTVGLSLSGRLQIQYAGLGTDIDGAASQPAPTSHFFLRRIYFGVKANLGNGWSSTFNYDFAGSTFDQAFVTWRKDDALSVDVGFRKAPIGLEEWYTSSGSLKAIERSPATRYFVESNNGRRLGAGSYRIGVFASGKFDNGVFYTVAATNPERNEDGTAGVTSAGSSANNSLSYWGNLGYTKKLESGLTYTVAGSFGLLPDQGGPSNTGLGKGDDMAVYSVWGTVANGPFEVIGEYFWGTVDHGINASRDAEPKAYYLQPSYKISDTLEATVRYTEVNAGARGVNLSDGIRSAPGGGTMKNMTEWYYGLTWFFRGNDAKLQLGYIHGESKDTVTGASAKATTDGIRSQMQINF
ncbi:MAG: porin [Candidatus Didemnitutus sp.]|nr:porin [Candidatus Didemnitutus sp.]